MKSSQSSVSRSPHGRPSLPVAQSSEVGSLRSYTFSFSCGSSFGFFSFFSCLGFSSFGGVRAAAAAGAGAAPPCCAASSSFFAASSACTSTLTSSFGFFSALAARTTSPAALTFASSAAMPAEPLVLGAGAAAGAAEAGAGAGAEPWLCCSLGFMAGNSSTSLMLMLSVRSIVRRSMPRPQPPVGGRPYSSALTNVSSMTCASSSPLAFWFACSWNRSRCTSGSLSSVYALHSSRLFTKSSNRSVTWGLERWYLASGLMICGWSHTKPGLVHCSSR
mmetsp:Transcript_7365/g.25965  ORF Transcript_7365/g.25965 Transcript_7365/m.25965 type:complete len:276 (+) Transcript_7365:477-1304(+)